MRPRIEVEIILHKPSARMQWKDVPSLRWNAISVGDANQVLAHAHHQSRLFGLPVVVIEPGDK